MHYERSFSVSATPDVVWSVMADVEHWHTWTESIRSIEIVDGTDSANSTDQADSANAMGLGSTATVRQPGFPAATWTVTEWVPGCSFTWESPAPGLHSVGVHAVHADTDNTSTVTLAIHQTGVMSGLMGVLFGRRSRRFVDMEADGLRARVEAPDSAD